MHRFREQDSDHAPASASCGARVGHCGGRVPRFNESVTPVFVHVLNSAGRAVAVPESATAVEQTSESLVSDFDRRIVTTEVPIR